MFIGPDPTHRQQLPRVLAIARIFCVCTYYIHKAKYHQTLERRQENYVFCCCCCFFPLLFHENSLNSTIQRPVNWSFSSVTRMWQNHWGEMIIHHTLCMMFEHCSVAKKWPCLFTCVSLVILQIDIAFGNVSVKRSYQSTQEWISSIKCLVFLVGKLWILYPKIGILNGH